MVLCFLLMGRYDMADIEVNKMKLWADDATLAQLIEAWNGFYSVNTNHLERIISREVKVDSRK